MSLEIEFLKDYKSLKMDDIEAIVTLPDFSVITGLNGTGKSHLLEAIGGGDRVANVYDGGVRIENISFMKQIGMYQRSPHDKVFSLDLNGAVHDMCIAFKYLRDKASDNEPQVDVIELAVTGRDSKIRKEAAIILKEILRMSGKDLESLDDDDIRNYYPVDDHLIHGEVFEYDFRGHYIRYRDRIEHNKYMEYLVNIKGENRKFLTEDQLMANIGEPPWEFINEILDRFGSNVKTNYPERASKDEMFEFKFLNKHTGAELNYKDLSSGERVIVSIAACFGKQRTMAEYPQLLLLDEPDANLHPSVVKDLMKVLNGFLVKEKGVKIIITTHSPTTVAMSPKESIYVMRYGRPKVEKINQSLAVILLNEGVPTLSVSIDGRRQVFVESGIDAELYSTLYELCKTELKMERTLAFIEVGNKENSCGEKNAGCDQVKRMVRDLERNGNRSIFGLIDWDGVNDSSERIHVLSHGIRNAIESLIFDPVIIATTAIRYNREVMVHRGIIEESDAYLHIQNWDSEKWRNVVDRIQAEILQEDVDIHEKIKIVYFGGVEVYVSKVYLHMDDKILTNKIMDCFSFLETKKNANNLMKKIVNEILFEHKSLIPKDLIDTFEGILKKDVVW